MTPMLALHEYGNTSGQTLVLLHPGGVMHSVWLPSIRAWQNRYRILAIDLCIPSTAPSSIPKLAVQITALIQQRCHSPACLIGASLGANLALQIASTAALPINALVLDSAQLGGPAPAVLRGAVALLSRVAPLLPARLITQLAMLPFQRYSQADQALIRREIASLGKVGMLRHIAAHFGYDLRDQLSQIQVPTLILAGEQDMLTRAGEPQKLASSIKTARLELVPHAGHVTFLSQPDEFQGRVDAFLIQLDL